MTTWARGRVKNSVIPLRVVRAVDRFLVPSTRSTQISLVLSPRSHPIVSRLVSFVMAALSPLDFESVRNPQTNCGLERAASSSHLATDTDHADTKKVVGPWLQPRRAEGAGPEDLVFTRRTV
jgi:hypothetical protein